MQTKTHINKGIIIAFAAIIFNATSHFNKSIFEEWTTFGFAAIIIVGVAIAVFLFGKEVDNKVNFGNSFSYGFKTAAVATCIYFIYTLLALNLFFPDFIAQKFNRQLEEAKRLGAFDEKTMNENLEMGVKMGKKIMFYTNIAGSVMGTLFLGIIGSLIGAVGVSKK